MIVFPFHRGGGRLTLPLAALVLVGCISAPKDAPLIDADLSARVGTIESDVTGIKATVGTIQGDVSGIKANTTGSFNITGNPVTSSILAGCLFVSHLAALLMPSPIKRKSSPGPRP